MTIFSHERRLTLHTDERFPLTFGTNSTESCRLVQCGQAAITLSEADTGPFLSQLPPGAPDYRSYDELTELIWRNSRSREDLSPGARRNPQHAYSSATYIWKQLVRHAHPELYRTLHSVPQEAVFTSTLNRTIVSDEFAYGFYENVVDGRIEYALGRRSITYLQMLLADQRPELYDPTWPEEVLDFMSASPHD